MTQGDTYQTISASNDPTIGGNLVANLIKVRPHWIMLLALVPFFMSTSGVLYQLQGYQASIVLNSAGREYEEGYIREEESNSAKWLAEHRQGGVMISTSGLRGSQTLISQGGISPLELQVSFVEVYQETGRAVDAYFYLRPTEIVARKIYEKYRGLFATKSKIYSSGPSEILR